MGAVDAVPVVGAIVLAELVVGAVLVVVDGAVVLGVVVDGEVVDGVVALGVVVDGVVAPGAVVLGVVAVGVVVLGAVPRACAAAWVSAASNAVNSAPPPPERGPIELSGAVPAVPPGVVEVVAEVDGAVGASVSTARRSRQLLAGGAAECWLKACSALIVMVCPRPVAELL